MLTWQRWSRSSEGIWQKAPVIVFKSMFVFKGEAGIDVEKIEKKSAFRLRRDKKLLIH
jgi:hypothetical protein